MTVTLTGRQVAVVAAAFLAVLGVAGALWARDRSRAASAEREAERVRLEAAGLIVEREATEADLRAKLTVAVRRSADLKAALDDALASVREAKPIYVTRYVTRPGVAGGEPRPTCPAPSGAGPAPAPTPPPPCLLAPGDLGRVEVDVAGIETRAGNRVVVGAASAWRLTPEPVTRLFGGPFDADASRIDVVAPEPRRSGWALGLGASVGPSGWALGPAVGLPPFWRLEAVATAGIGPDGNWQATAVTLVRLR